MARGYRVIPNSQCNMLFSVLCCCSKQTFLFLKFSFPLRFSQCLKLQTKQMQCNANIYKLFIYFILQIGLITCMVTFKQENDLKLLKYDDLKDDPKLLKYNDLKDDPKVLNYEDLQDNSKLLKYDDLQDNPKLLKYDDLTDDPKLLKYNDLQDNPKLLKYDDLKDDHKLLKYNDLKDNP